MPATDATAKPDALLAEALQTLDPGRRYRIAFSGGRDSSVLLHALRTLRPELDLDVMHVDHAIHPHSVDWAEHCREFCRGLDLSVNIQRLDAPSGRGNLEAWAREQRYQRLSQDLQPGHIVVTAHHRDDQVETFLLNLLRGSGVQGLAAMPRERALGAGVLLRPLLQLDSAQIAAYASAHELRYLDDPSNASLEHDRNFLRHQIIPQLSVRFPHAAENIVRSAALLAEQRDEAVQMDSSPLALAPLRGQSAAVRNRKLRHWLRSQGFAPPRYRMLEELWRQLLAGAEDAQPVVGWPGVELRRYRDQLFAMAPLEPPPCVDWAVADRGLCEWPPGGQLRWSIPGAQAVRITSPCGGESLRLGGMRRRLKNLYQAAAVPPWKRQRDPLLWLGDELLAVGNRWRCDEVDSFEWSWVVDEG